MVFMAAHPDDVVSTKKIAEVLSASENHLSKVLQRLVHQQLIKSVRGPQGGYMLAHSPEDISVLQVYEAIEGPMRPTSCILKKPVCDGSVCLFGTLLESTSSMIRTYFASTMISELVKVFERKEKHLASQNH